MEVLSNTHHRSWFSEIALGCCISMYVFPFSFRFLPYGINTKIIIAIAGLTTYIYHNVSQRRAYLLKDTLFVSMAAIMVTFASMIATFYNNTPDYTYVTYIFTMWVWLGGAYFICECLKLAYGTNLVKHLVIFLIVICACQCLLAISIDHYDVIDKFLDKYVEQGQDFLRNLSYRRLYGLGASLDVAGIRFSAALIMCAFILVDDRIHLNWHEIYLLTLCFVIVSVIGNIVARTTTVGLIISLIYIIWRVIFHKSVKTATASNAILTVFAITALFACIMYLNDPIAKKNLRFGFEGFFKIVEEGAWQTDSNSHLATMIHWPDNLKTWILGDGYFGAAMNDLYYRGNDPYPFYKGTDIGYLRFIFYFGLIGLGAFSFFFLVCAKVCQNKFPDYSQMIIMLLMLNFIVWLKVATDIFVIFSLLLMCENESENENSILYPGNL